MSAAPLWVVSCRDAPGAVAARIELRPRHSLWWRTGPLTPLVYGPLLAGPEGEGPPVGSLFVVAAPDRAAVEAHLAGDPFRTGGVWAEVRVDAFANSANAPIRLTADPADHADAYADADADADADNANAADDDADPTPLAARPARKDTVHHAR